jgi:hypothetical protein
LVEGDSLDSLTIDDSLVNTDAANAYIVTYTATDSLGNIGTATLSVTVEDTVGPVITLNETSIQHEQGTAFIAPAPQSVVDLVEGDALDPILIDATSVDIDKTGIYFVTYTAIDSSNNEGHAILSVAITDTTKPVITLMSDEVIYHDKGTLFETPQATAWDSVDLDISHDLNVDTNAVNVNIEGSYSVTFNVTDASNNRADEVVLTVIVEDMFKLEANRIVLPATTGIVFNTVSFQQTYSETPLIFVMNTNDNSDPADIRIRNVSTTGFEIAQIEPDGSDGNLVETVVDYFVVEEGINTLPNGTVIEAGYIDTTKTASKAFGLSWETIVYSEQFTNPVVQAQIQTVNNDMGNIVSTPFITASIDNVSSTQFSLSMDRAEVTSGEIIANERVAYFVMEQDTSDSFIAKSGNTIFIEATNTTRNIRGTGNSGCLVTAFSQSYSAVPLVIATKTDRRGSDGGWIRRCSLTAYDVGLVVDEDQFGNTERNHIDESASILAISEPFSASLR